MAGGFKTYLISPAWMPGSLEPTAYAVELMEIYGVPDDLDLNWVRSFLKPTMLRISNDKWMAAATRERLTHTAIAPTRLANTCYPCPTTGSIVV